jgi:hypothetical protein
MANMLRQNPHLRLMGALGFSASDVAANSRGELSHEQEKALQQARTVHMARWIVLIVALWLIGLPLGVPWLILLFGMAVVISVIIAGWQRFTDDLTGGVIAVSGRAELIPTLPLFLNYRLQLNGDSFTVSREAGEAFIAGRIYRLFYSPASRTVLSAELVA